MGRRVLLVEGKDDLIVIDSFCKERGLAPPDEIKPHEGVQRLLAAIPQQIKAAQEGDIIGVVVDADDDVAVRWRSLRAGLASTGYPESPDEPDRMGLILDALSPGAGGARPRVGVWLMPDNQVPGKLETFLALLVPVQSLLFAHAKASVDGIPSGEQLFRPVDRDKALIHTWLAWQAKPGKPFGTAITAGFLDSKTPQADLFADWLRRLYR